MQVKVLKVPTGIHDARVAIDPGVTPMGAAQVTAIVSSVDAHGVPSVAISLRLTPNEARDIAARLLRLADSAEGMLPRVIG